MLSHNRAIQRRFRRDFAVKGACLSAQDNKSQQLLITELGARCFLLRRFMETRDFPPAAQLLFGRVENRAAVAEIAIWKHSFSVFNNELLVLLFKLSLLFSICTFAYNMLLIVSVFNSNHVLF